MSAQDMNQFHPGAQSLPVQSAPGAFSAAGPASAQLPPRQQQAPVDFKREEYAPGLLSTIKTEPDEAEPMSIDEYLELERRRHIEPMEMSASLKRERSDSPAPVQASTRSSNNMSTSNNGAPTNNVVVPRPNPPSIKLDSTHWGVPRAFEGAKRSPEEVNEAIQKLDRQIIASGNDDVEKPRLLEIVQPNRSFSNTARDKIDNMIERISVPTNNATVYLLPHDDMSPEEKKGTKAKYTKTFPSHRSATSSVTSKASAGCAVSH